MTHTIFDLHTSVLTDYRDFVQSFIQIADERARAFVDHHLTTESRLWPEPLIQLSPSYALGATVDDLATRGIIARETARIFRTNTGTPFHLYRHQEEAIIKANANESFIVTSGTGSGKSLTYFLPIIDHVIRHVQREDHLVALVVYPMNALVNSQLQGLHKVQTQYEQRTGQQFPVRFVKYTGETSNEEREAMRQHPPHVILTNYVMLELMLVRAEDRRLFDNTAGLRFLVFDELHTYRGRQGADVAMLVRRLKERFNMPALIHIGTSATMVARPDATAAERRQTVAAFASRFFGHSFSADDVIEEALTPLSEGPPPSPSELRAVIDRPLPHDPAAFRRHPLTRFIEYELGVAVEPDGRWKRRTPRSLSEVVQQLAEQTNADPRHCAHLLRRILTDGKGMRFKLHQFISQGQTLYATLEPADRRTFSLDGQLQQEDGKLLVPLKFCRQCGQDYYHVVRIDDRFVPLTAREVPDEDGLTVGYLMLAPTEDDWSAEHIPEEWYDSKGKLRANWRDRVPTKVWVHADGTYRPTPCADAQEMWWQPVPFALCLACGEFYTGREREFAKLVSLSSEGRSSTTTILATSLLRHAGRTRAARDKLLTFTDNRQDASFQAGHFNDFVHAALLRTALCAALQQHSTLTFDTVAQAVVQASGLTIADIAKEHRLDPDSLKAKAVWEAFTDLTEYRLYEDLRRSWRLVPPNLEQVGLLTISYRGLDELVRHPNLTAILPVDDAERRTIVRAIFDYFRRKLAISASVLTEDTQQQLRRRCQVDLNEFWGLDPDYDELRPATRFVLQPGKGRVNDNTLSLGPRSLIGRFLQARLGLSKEAYEPTIRALVEVLVRQGFLTQGRSPIGDTYQLDPSCFIWQLGDGTAPPPDPLYRRRTASNGNTPVRRPVNAFFQRFYRQSPTDLVALEAREHTAQVVNPGEREQRERRFRWEETDRTKEHNLGRRLPYLVCSPTMELGVDIADLELVHLRNVPPTPANYAQRSGRAGRQGQPGMIFTYCGAYHNHDQYFFRRQADMVAGSVRPPRLDLTNEALLTAHIHALWLAHIGLPLGQSIEQVIDIDKDDLPLKEDVAHQIHLSDDKQAELQARVRRLLAADKHLFEGCSWFTDQWIEQVIKAAPEAFDRAFHRWRELYRAATRQRIVARQEEDAARTREEQDRAQRKQSEARRQLNLLRQVDVTREEGDFYPYRYLASEGFLPGYNFPALPVRAWVPRGQDGDFIARPRFLAIREFAPQNFLYHEGGQWESVAFIAPPGGLDERISTQRLCRSCGAFTTPDLDRCPHCDTCFDGTNSLLATILDMPNVRVRRRARITADEEERRRRGYTLETFFQVPDGSRGDEADVVVNGQPWLHLTYVPSATVLRVNHGWQSAQPNGFLVDMDSGEVYTSEDDHDHRRLSRQPRRERVRLGVQATQNMLLIRMDAPELRSEQVQPSLRAALKRGIEETFQLEEGELVAEPIGTGEHQAMLLYEVSEGGAGVLRRLIEDIDSFAQIVRSALTICHFDEAGNDGAPTCYAACYECLLSFENQHEALLVNRHRIRDILLHLAHSRVERWVDGRTRSEHLAWLQSLTDARSELERRFLTVLDKGGYRLPDDAQRRIHQPSCVPDFFYEPNVCIFCDGTVHDEPAQAVRDHDLRNALIRSGYRVIVIRYDDDIEQVIRRYPEVFGR